MLHVQNWKKTSNSWHKRESNCADCVLAKKKLCYIGQKMYVVMMNQMYCVVRDEVVLKCTLLLPDAWQWLMSQC